MSEYVRKEKEGFYSAIQLHISEKFVFFCSE